MLKQWALAALATFAVSTAHAQITVDESPILNAYQRLASNPQFILDVNGSKVYRNTTTAYRTIVSWDYQAEPLRARIEVREYQNDVPTLRIVGDGENVFIYNFSRREYATYNYGGYHGRPENYRSKLIQTVTDASVGQTRYVAQLLSDLLVPDSARYRSWMPGVNPTMLPEGVTQDPVLSWRNYVATPTSTVLLYNARPKRTIAVQLNAVNGYDDQKDLAAITFNQSEQIGGSVQELAWSIVPFIGTTTYDEAIFTPYNYADIPGWRPVSGASTARAN